MLLRDNSTTLDRRTDLLIEYDDRSREFPVGVAVARKYPNAVPISRIWYCPTCLDQHNEGACGAFAATHIVLAEPGIRPVSQYTASFARQELYFPAQHIDSFPGGEYPGADPVMGGTSLLAVMKVLMEMGLITEYNWAFTFEELLIGVCYFSPAQIGSLWLEGMNYPDQSGTVRPTGAITGRHSYMLYGYNVHTGRLLFLNSWGLNWGLRGKFQMSVADFMFLRKMGGFEACFMKKVALEIETTIHIPV